MIHWWRRWPGEEGYEVALMGPCEVVASACGRLVDRREVDAHGPHADCPQCVEVYDMVSEPEPPSREAKR